LLSQRSLGVLKLAMNEINRNAIMPENNKSTSVPAIFQLNSLNSGV